MPSITLIPNDYILRKNQDVSWRKWFQMVWNDIEWPVIFGLGFLSLILGILGFSQYYNQAAQTISFWDALYMSLQLFSLGGNFESFTFMPISLGIARFLAPALAAYTLSQAFFVVFKEQLELFRLVRSTNHTVICGLGRKGTLLARNLRREDQSLVIIEQDNNNPNVELCRELGAIVIIGDARDPRLLLKAGVSRARRLIVVCGDDGINIEVTKQSHRMIGESRKTILTCTAHIVNPELISVLKQRELSMEGIFPFRVDFFNIYDTSANLLLGELFNNDQMHCPPHLLVIGMGRLGESIIVNAARKWYLKTLAQDGKLTISIIDPNAVKNMEMLVFRFPLLREVCDFHCHEYQTDTADFQKANFAMEGYPSISNAYICLEHPLIGFQTGFALFHRLHNPNLQIMIRMNEDSGLAAFMREGMNEDLGNIKAFGLLEQTCKIHLLDDGFHNSIARAIHEDYADRERQKGYTVQDNPNLAGWEHLSEEIRESNKRQADHIGIKLNSISCGMEPWRECGRENFEFSTEELEKMARLEHERWCEDKKWAGWKYGEIRDDNRKIHPDLIGWDEGLTTDAKDKDYAAVRLIPNLLARAGFQVYRVRSKG